MKIKYILFVAIAIFTFSSCYKEQHFTLPGNPEDDVIVPDTLPFPFDENRQAGVYLIKEGKVDYSKVVLKGFSDFSPEFGDSVAWYQGDGFYGSVQHKNIYSGQASENYGNNANSFMYVGLVGKQFLELGPGKNYYIYAKMSYTYMAGTAPWFFFGGTSFAKRHAVGFDGGNGFAGYPVFFANFAGQLVQPTNWPSCTELYRPDEPFEMEIAIVDYYAYFRVNKRVIWVYNLPHDVCANPMQLLTWRNSVKFYDLYIEGNHHQMNQVGWQYEKGYINTQVPSLTKAANKDILVFAEGHVKNLVLTNNEAKAKKRSNASAIVMKRSTDQGTSWSEWTTLVGGLENPSVNVKPISVTAANGLTHLLYSVDNSGFLSGDYTIKHMSSADNGNTWSSPVSVSALPAGGFTQVQTLSGHGIQMKSGRLVIPVSCVKTNTQTVATLYSDDNGATWFAGAAVSDNDARTANVVELADGRLMMLISHVGTTTKRKVSYSTDGGITWSAPGYTNIAFATGVNGYGYRWQGSTLTTPDGKLIHCTPAGQSEAANFENDLYKAYNAPVVSKGLNMTTSTDGGVTWSAPATMFDVQVNSDYVFFSGKAMDAVLLDDGSVLCVTEGGVRLPTEGLVSFRK